MNPNAPHSISFRSMLSVFIQNRHLILQMTKREIKTKYQNSLIGVFWTVFNPILMLFVYTFVFSVVFKSRWLSGSEASTAEYAFIMFVGILFHGLLSSVMSQSSDLIVNNTNYVKKVVFPIEILVVVKLLENTFYFLIGMLVLVAVVSVSTKVFTVTTLLLPLILIPFLCFVLGVGWILCALGVFVRDISYGIGVITTMLLFLSPIFYPIDALPQEYQFWMNWNPLTYFITEARNMLLNNQAPDWSQFGCAMTLSWLFMWVGFIWFQKTRRGFADVI